uniref:Uncharacterized protein n=1 Tax=Romanomermis culicivorax TaxID=13658 RepID=A0A915L7H7_ROMCU
MKILCIDKLLLRKPTWLKVVDEIFSFKSTPKASTCKIRLRARITTGLGFGLGLGLETCDAYIGLFAFFLFKRKVSLK